MDFLLFTDGNSCVNTVKMNILLTGADDDIQNLYCQIPRKKVVISERTSPPLTYTSKSKSIPKQPRTLTK